MENSTEENPNSTPPKLSLFSLSKPSPEPPGLKTPPLHASVSVPFLWEEAPGKPRPISIESKLKTAKSLDLPPRLFSDAKVAHFSSPTTAVEEPIPGEDPPSTLSFRFPDSWSETERKDGSSAGAKYFGSRRWGSFRKKKDIPINKSDGDYGGGDDRDTKVKVKITRFRSRRSLLRASNSMSHLMEGIYESIKQVIPWKRRQDQMRKVS